MIRLVKCRKGLRKLDATRPLTEAGVEIYRSETGGTKSLMPAVAIGLKVTVALSQCFSKSGRYCP